MKKITLILFCMYFMQTVHSQEINIPHAANAEISSSSGINVQWFLGKNYGKYIINTSQNVENKSSEKSLEEKDLKKISVTPNPFKTELSIQLDESFSSLSVYNLSGQLILSKKISNNERNISLLLNNIPTGFYILNLTNKNFTKTVKLIKE